MESLPLPLALIGALSPLLTFTRLLQQKEWRWDRLIEHLRHEGYWTQLLGRMRPLLILPYILSLAIRIPSAPSYVLPGTLAVLAIATILQIGLRRQRTPIWTHKAILVTGTALLLLLVTIRSLPVLLFPFLPLAAPFFVLVALLLLSPLDRFLKNRIMRRARELRTSLLHATVIGIVGSVGKSTTKELLHCVLSDHAPLTTPEHVNTEMGVALWLLSQRQALKERKHPLLIIEMGAYREGEIALLCSIVQPTIGVVTPLGSDHLALFGSEEAIVEANAELLHALPPDAPVFINADSPACRLLADRCAQPITVASSSSYGQWHPVEYTETEQGISFLPAVPSADASYGNSTFHVALHGKHNVGNAMLALAVAAHVGVAPERAKENLKALHPVAHTFSLRRVGDVLVLDDTYNVSPLSFHAALAWAKGRPERPRVLVTSGLLELGHAEDAHLLSLGEEARYCVERVIFTTSRGRDTFAKGFGTSVELLTASTPPVTSGSVLLCVGRMSPNIPASLLP